MGEQTFYITNIESGIDWIQATYPCVWGQDEDIREALTILMDNEEGNGYRRKLVRVQGYEGHSVGSASWLYNVMTRRALVRVSGSLAQDSAGWLIPILNDSGGSITRLDVQTTVWYNSYNPRKAREYRDIIMTSERRRNYPRITYVDGCGKGDTLYIGSADSDRRVRIYDKYAESGGESEYAFAWRYEVQHRDKYAQEVARSLSSLSFSPSACNGVVRYTLRALGLTLPGEGGEVKPTRYRERDSDLERLRFWLRKQVSPSCQRLALVDGWDEVIRLIKGEC